MQILYLVGSKMKSLTTMSKSGTLLMNMPSYVFILNWWEEMILL
jgi:hypothetical protein